MIAYLSGKLIEKKDTSVILDVHGVGYDVFCSPRTAQWLGEMGSACSLFTYAQYRADGVSLFGFLTSQEKLLFLSLIKVDSVGPKSALNIMSAAPWDELVHLIEDGDISSLSKLPKISKKTAEHLVVKLKGKLGEIILMSEAQGETLAPSAGEVSASAGGTTSHDSGPSTVSRRARSLELRKMRNEATSALGHLGFRPQDVEQALDELDEKLWSGELQEVIRLALTHLSGNI